MIEWLTAFKTASAVRSASAWAKSSYDRMAGQRPQIDFEVGEYGPNLCVTNTRDTIIIVESLHAIPPLLSFSASHEPIDLVRAVVDQRRGESDEAMAAMDAKGKVAFIVVTFDPFQSANPDQTISVTMHWRSVPSSGLFSSGKLVTTITVRDLRELQTASDKKRLRGRSSGA